MEHELSARETQLVETARTFAIEKIAPLPQSGISIEQYHTLFSERRRT